MRGFARGDENVVNVKLKRGGLAVAGAGADDQGRRVARGKCLRSHEDREDECSLAESNVVDCKVLGRFVVIPFEFERHLSSTELP